MQFKDRGKKLKVFNLNVNIQNNRNYWLQHLQRMEWKTFWDRQANGDVPDTKWHSTWRELRHYPLDGREGWISDSKHMLYTRSYKWCSISLL